MSILRVSLGFAEVPDTELSGVGRSVGTKLQGNLNFTTPVVAPPVLLTEVDKFDVAITAAAQGGTQLTAAKNDQRGVVIGLLRELAAYVQSQGKNDLTIILSSGFTVNKTDRTRRPLSKPVITNIDNFASTQLMVTMPPLDNARSYEFRARVGDGDWRTVAISTKARNVILGGFTPGATYDLQGRGVGGTTGYSDWSDPVSHMAT